jgi:hypothetical protein
VTLDERPSGERSAPDDVLAVVRAVVGRGRSLAGSGATVLSGGAEDAVRTLVARRAERALRPGAAVVSTADLIDALDPRTSTAISPWVSAGVLRLARTGRIAKVVGGRTPVGLAVRFGPALYGAISGNLRGLDAALGHVVSRARARKVEPDPDRLRRVVVQALAGDHLDPGSEPDHTALVRVWLGDAGRRAVPFGDQIKGLRSSRTPEATAALLDGLDPRDLTAR